MSNSIFIMTLFVAFIIAIVISPFFIPFLQRLKFGQSIRKEGPSWHQSKSGTPTMGGIVILLSVVLATIGIGIFFDVMNVETYLLLFVLLGYGLIGFLDDFIKVVMKRNLGLTSKQKLFGQLLIAIIFFFVLKQTEYETTVAIPGTDIHFDLGWMYVIFLIFMLVGASNAVNLTDGLDGLLSGTAAIAFGTYAVLAYNLEQYEVAIFSIAIVGAVLGFLVFNAHPAKVFMGDTGSLALGGAIAAIAILTKMELLLILIGGVFVLETLSVIIQVTSFKLTGKRVFKMSPLHHHFEMSGWSEWRVVITFWLVGLLFAGLAIYMEVWM
ncbi:phospho-N-acetylmuramoyl-pentapeptide-transferase [Massilibacterium senegalense]|uniref:phospho-N-acetylmuramoyl-pentapeptide- transferase n=1 Tax=Massilibacterium senegalense TaxID=1632858 RepID=UPI000782F71D|nr:phospho-N-acetylmuramoyl-pentapeptide-transferase [Massilibacterium senegalense]